MTIDVNTAKSVGSAVAVSPAKRGSAAWAYGAAATGGCALILAVPTAWFIPVIAMLAYLSYGLRESQQQGYVLEFGDSFYYLGFTLTICALLASLKPFQGGAVEPVAVLHSFGLGLLTTLIGVIGRTVIQIFYRNARESLEATNRRIEAEAVAYLTNLQQLNERATAILAAAVTTLDADLKKQFADSQSQLAEYRDILAAAVESARGLKIDTAAVDAGVAAAKSALDRQAAALNRQAEAISNQAATIANSTSGLGARLQDLGNAARELQGRFSGVRVDVTPLAASIDGASTALSHAGARLMSQFEAVSSATQTASAEMSRLQERIAGIDVAPLRSGVSRIARELETMAGAIGQQSADLSARALQPLQQELEQTLQQARGLNALLDEIVAAVRTTLRQL